MTLTAHTEEPDSLIPPLRFHVIQPNLYCGSYPRLRNKRFLEGLGLKTILSITPEPIGGFPKDQKPNSASSTESSSPAPFAKQQSLDEKQAKDSSEAIDSNTKPKEKEEKEEIIPVIKQEKEKKKAEKNKDKDNVDLAKEDEWLLKFAKEQNINLVHIPSAPPSNKSKKKRGVPLEYEVVRQACQYMIDQDFAPMYIHCMNGSQVTCLLVACLRKLSFWSMAAISDEFLRYCDMEPADANFVEGFSAEIEVPQHTVPWIWQGLSKTGVVKHHPTLKFNEEKQQKGQTNKS